MFNYKKLIKNKEILLLIIVLFEVANGFAQAIQYIDDDAPDRDSTEAETLVCLGIINTYSIY